MSRRTKEITIVVQVDSGTVTTAHRILSNALNQFKYNYASIVIAPPEFREISKKGDQK